MLDSAGGLIGINTANYSPSGAYAGIGFAVPVDTVNRVVPQLIAQGKYIRPNLGITVDSDINQILTKQLGIEGVLVRKVEPGSAAGLRSINVDRDGDLIPGDIILVLDGNPVDSVATFLGDSTISTSVITSPCASGGPYAKWMSMSFCGPGAESTRRSASPA